MRHIYLCDSSWLAVNLEIEGVEVWTSAWPMFFLLFPRHERRPSTTEEEGFSPQGKKNFIFFLKKEHNFIMRLTLLILVSSHFITHTHTNIVMRWSYCCSLLLYFSLNSHHHHHHHRDCHHQISKSSWTSQRVSRGLRSHVMERCRQQQKRERERKRDEMTINCC